MQRSTFTSRFLIPLFLALAVMIGSRAVYGNADRIDDRALYHAVALLAGTVQFLSIVLAAMLVYPVTYFRRAGLAERVIAGSVNPVVWVAIDSYHVSQAFTWIESLYYGANIGSILLAWNFALMGVLELACRCVRKKRGEGIRVVTPLPFIPLLVFLFVVFVLSKEGGAYYFNLLLDGYLALFRS